MWEIIGETQKQQIRAKTNFIFANYGYGDASSIDVKNLKITIDSPLEILKIFN